MGHTNQLLSKIPVFLPISFFMVTWEFIVLLYIVVDFSLTILVQCFHDQFLRDWLYHYFDRFLIALLLLDIIFSLNTCIIRKGVIISERKKIAVEYLKSPYFVVDLISLIFSILQLSLNTLAKYQTFYNFFVFIKIIKIYQFDKHIKKYGLKTFNSLLIYEVSKNIIFLALISHIVGSFAYLLDYNLLMENYYPDYAQDAYWLTSSYAYTNIINEPFWVRYSYAFYYAISILSGIAYGDLVPQNPIQTVYSFFIMLLPLVIYSYIFNAIYDVISKKRQRNKQIKRYQFLAKRYFKTLRVKSLLQMKLITYLTFVFRKTVLNSDFVDNLAPSARKQYTNHTIHAKFDYFIFEQLLSITPLTDKVKFKSSLIKIIKEQTFPERYKMLNPNKIKLYYINQGLCKRVTINQLKYSDDTTRKQYACFYSFLTGIVPYNLKYQSASFVICQSINRSQFLQLLRERNNYELNQAFHLMKQQKMMYNNQTVVGEKCFFCHSQAHFFNSCHYLRPKFHLTRPKITHSLRQKYNRRPVRSQRMGDKQRGINYMTNKGAKQQIGIQCDLRSHKRGKYKFKQFQKLCHMRVYYPEYNIPT